MSAPKTYPKALWSSLGRAASLIALTAMIAWAAFASPALARESVLNLQNSGFFAELAPFTDVLEDVEATVTLDQVVSGKTGPPFAPVETNVIDFGFSASQFWLRTPIRNASGQPGTWKLSPDVAILDSIDIYLLPSGNGAPQQIFSARRDDPFSARLENHRSYVADFTLAADQEAELLIRYQSSKATQLALYIESPDAYYARTRTEDAHNGIVLGALLAMTIISVIYMSALGLKAGFFYGAYLLVMTLFLYHNDGYTFQFLWPESPNWNYNASVTFGLSALAFLILFVRSFVTAFERNPMLSRIMLTIAIFYFAMGLASYWLQVSTAFKTLTAVASAVGGFVPLAGTIIAVRDRQPGSVRLMLGGATVCLSILVIAFGYLTPGIFYQDITGHVMRYSLIFEGLLFASAVFAHTHTVRQERAGALRRQIELGEEKLALSEALRTAERSHRAAVQLAETQRESIAATAHDIRQPLASLRMAIMRLDGRNPKKAQQIADSFEYLDAIVNESLERAKVENGKGGVAGFDPVRNNSANGHGDLPTDKPEVFDIRAVLGNIMTMFEHEAALKNLTFEIDPCEEKVIARPVDLMRIVSNLVSNAIRNTQKGGVFISCRREADYLKIEVRDTGVGFDPDKQARLRRAYERSGEYEGTGLGLSVVERLAEANRIRTTLNSVPGQGSSFILDVPAA